MHFGKAFRPIVPQGDGYTSMAANPNAKSAIVTGAAAGIGAQVALLLAQRGFHLTLLDRDIVALEATADEM